MAEAQAINLRGGLATSHLCHRNLMIDRDQESDGCPNPELGKRGGLVMSLLGPQFIQDDKHESLKYMNPLSQSREAVFVLMLPHNMLFPLKYVTEPSKMSTSSSLLSDDLDLSHRKSVVNFAEVNALKYLRLLPVEILESLSLTKVRKKSTLMKRQSNSDLSKPITVVKNENVARSRTFRKSMSFDSGGGAHSSSVTSTVKHNIMVSLPSNSVIRAYQVYLFFVDV